MLRIFLLYSGLVSSYVQAAFVSFGVNITQYSTTFPATENPISQGGKWINGGTTGIDWANIQTGLASDGVTHIAMGTGPANTGATVYADPNNILAGTWPNDQQIVGVVYSSAPSPFYKEVELHVRFSISPHWDAGYGVDCSVVPSTPYLDLGKWNGPLGDFTAFARITSTYCANGDVLKLTVIGNVLTVYKNGVQLMQAQDSTFTSGAPGIDFYNSADTVWNTQGFSSIYAGPAP